MEGVSGVHELMGDGSDIITNKVFTAEIEGDVDLCSAKLLQLRQYKPPGSFRGGVLHLFNETYLLFHPKNIVIIESDTEPRVESFLKATDIALTNLKCHDGYYTAEAENTIDLFSKKLRALEGYKPPSKFAGAVLKLPGGTFLMFSSGKVIINGVKTEPDLLEFTLETNISLKNATMSHCSGSLKVDPQNLYELAKRISDSLYEPELHPGLFFHVENCSVIVQHTGAIIFCGCRSANQAIEVKQKILKLINTI